MKPPPDQPSTLENADRWREAVLTAGLAVFDWDVGAKRIWRSPEMLPTWDYPEGPNDGVDGARAMLHPDDYPAFRARMTEIEAGMLDRATLELRMRTRDGTYRWVRWRPAWFRPAPTGGPPASRAGTGRHSGGRG